MLLSYYHCFGADKDYPELCILADKPDAFSIAVPLERIGVTSAAVYRVGPGEAFIADLDPSDGAIIIKPVASGKLLLTPDVADGPGMRVKKIKVRKLAPGKYQTFYLQDRNEEGDWQEWDPTKRRV
jgi:hypothetical protein